MGVNLMDLPKIIVVLFGLIAAPFLCARAAEVAPSTPLYFDLGVIDLGVHSSDEPVVVEAVLRSRHGTPVKIVRVRTDCGCSTPVLSAGEVPPGGSVAIKTIMIVSHAGPFSGKLWVETDLPGADVIPLEWRGVYAQAGVGQGKPALLNVFPGLEIRMGGMLPGERRLFSLRTSRPDLAPFTFTEKYVPSANIKVDYDPIRSDDASHVFNVQLRASEELGAIEEAINFLSPLDDSLLATVSITGSVKSPIAVYPASLLVTPDKSEYTLYAVAHIAPGKRDQTAPPILENHIWRADTPPENGLRLKDVVTVKEIPFKDAPNIVAILLRFDQVGWDPNRFAAGSLSLAFSSRDKTSILSIPVVAIPSFISAE